MLLIEPPLDIDEWSLAKDGEPEYQSVFQDYCEAYEHAVLALPNDQIVKVLVHLHQGLQDLSIGGDSLHTIVSRELNEENFEASNKVAKLVIVCALGQTLVQQGYDVQENTAWLLLLCRMLVPVYLGLAIDDHFGMLPVPI